MHAPKSRPALVLFIALFNLFLLAEFALLSTPSAHAADSRSSREALNEPYAAPNTCTSISYGAAPVSGTISSAGEEDCFTFTGAIGERVRAVAVEMSSGWNAYLELKRPNDTTQCGPGFDVNCLLDSNGTYTLLVQDFGDDDTGSYNLQLLRLNNPVGCTALSYGNAPTSGVVSTPPEHDCYTFTGVAGERVRAEAAETSGGLTASIELLRPDGTTLCGPSFDIECLLNADGAHTLLVSSFGDDDTGSYNLELLRLNNPVGCTGVAYADAPVSGVIGVPAEYDCYSFTGAVGDRVRAIVQETSGGFTGYIELLRPDGTTVCGPGFDVECLLNTDGAHTLLLRSFTAGDTGSYNLEMLRLNNPVGCTKLVLNARSKKGTLSVQGEIDCFTFDDRGKTLVRVAATPTANGLTPFLELLNPDGTSLCGPSFSPLTCTLGNVGQHAFLLRSFSGSETGSYNVNVGCTIKPAKPKPSSPGKDATVKSRRVLLQWNAPNCGGWYNVVVKKGSTSGTPADQKPNLSALKYKTKSLDPGGEYYWQVEACNNINCVKSAWRHFTVSSSAAPAGEPEE